VTIPGKSNANGCGVLKPVVCEKLYHVKGLYDMLNYLLHVIRMNVRMISFILFIIVYNTKFIHEK